ncbi:MAG: replicative DNA helicase [Parcubacteria group bacterium]|nr:replicative DNA helicase [Parcubacteria group bacterium]
MAVNDVSSPTIQKARALSLPPQNIEAEQSVLGAILTQPDAIVKIGDTLVTDDFYKPSHARIFAAMLELFERREPIDVVSLANRLKEKNELEASGGQTYLAELAATVPTALHVAHYAAIVQRKATLRRLIGAGQEIAELGSGEREDTEILLDHAEQKLFAVSQRYLKRYFTEIGPLIHEAWERVEELHRGDGKLRGIATGFAPLDNLLGGMQRSDLVILAARPSMGKSSLALDIVRHVALKEKLPVGIFSLEMSRDQLVDRLLCAQASLDLWKLRTGRLNAHGDDNDFDRLNHAMALLADAPIYIDDSPTPTVMEIRTKARRLAMEQRVGLLVIDYLQLLFGSRYTDNRVQEVSEISRALKGLARELSIPVLALSQLSRAVETRSPQIPQLSDLRESGSIEQDADVVMFIYREEMYRPESDRKHIADILVRKHRNGPTGDIELYFAQEHASFRALETHRGETRS